MFNFLDRMLPNQATLGYVRAQKHFRAGALRAAGMARRSWLLIKEKEKERLGKTAGKGEGEARQQGDGEYNPLEEVVGVGRGAERVVGVALSLSSPQVL